MFKKSLLRKVILATTVLIFTLSAVVVHAQPVPFDPSRANLELLYYRFGITDPTTVSEWQLRTWSTEWQYLIFGVGMQTVVRENVRSVQRWNLRRAELEYLNLPSINFRDGYTYIFGIRDENNNLVPHTTFYADSSFDTQMIQRAQASPAWTQIITRGGMPALEQLFRLPMYRRMTMQELRQFIDMYDALGGATDRELLEISRVNEIRAYYGLNTLEINRYMMIAGRLYAYYMSMFGFLGHNVGPYTPEVGAWQGASGQLARAFGVTQNGGNGGFNVGAQWWRNSPGHREYMLRAGASHGGIGIRGAYSYLFVGADTPVSAVTLYEASRLQD